MIALRDFTHRFQIIHNHFERGRSGVSGNIIGSGKDNDHFGLQRNHILTESNEHLWSCLSADAAIDIVGGKIFWVLLYPTLGN